MRLVLSVPEDFDFRNAVCSHGFFVLAPNRWDPARQCLHTTITLNDSTAVSVCARESARGQVVLKCFSSLSTDQRRIVKQAFVRMLRLDEDFAAFYALCRRSPSHEAAACMRFGRLLRSADLFEDIVKVICTCNVTWRQTVTMIDNVVRLWGVPARDESGAKGFPTPRILARVSPDELRTGARLGYRADFVQRLAAEVADGKLDLAQLENHPGPSDRLFKELRRIHGVGPYAAAHIAMLLGHYDRLAVDTELLRLLKTRHPRRRWTPAAISRYYQAWHPYQFLAYWFELWQDYTHHHGQSDQWDPAVTGQSITTLTGRSPQT